MAYDNRGTGVLFVNDKKTKDNQPDSTGTYTHTDGTEFKVAAWRKESKAGRKFLSFKMTPKDAQKASGEENQELGDTAF